MKKVKYISAIIFGNALFAFSVAAFIIPDRIPVGGVTGTAIVINRLSGFDTSLFVLLANVILLLIGWKILGLKFFLSTAASSVLYPLFLSVFQRIPALLSITENRLIASLFAGALLGASIGILMREGSSSGGTDIIGLIVQKYTHINVAVIVWTLDFVIIGAQLFVSDSESLLLGIITVAVETLSLDRVMLIGKAQIQVLVISESYAEIRKALLKTLDAGVTMLNIETGYGGKKQMGVICVIPPRRLYALKELVNSVDGEAFITVTKIKEVQGRGFTVSR